MNRTQEFRELSSKGLSSNTRHIIVSIQEEGSDAVLHTLRHQMKLDLQKLSVASKHFSPFQEDSSNFHKTLFHVETNLKQLGSHIHEMELNTTPGECCSQAKAHQLIVLMCLRQEMVTFTEELYKLLKLRDHCEAQQRNRRSHFQSLLSTRATNKGVHKSVHKQYGQSLPPWWKENPAANEDATTQIQENWKENGEEHRLPALVEVQKRIEAMSKLYTRFSHLLQTQEEGVLRIDQDITVTLDRVEQGNKELTRLFASQSHSTWLIVKVFATVLLMMVFGVVFL